MTHIGTKFSNTQTRYTFCLRVRQISHRGLPARPNLFEPVTIGFKLGPRRRFGLVLTLGGVASVGDGVGTMSSIDRIGTAAG